MISVIIVTYNSRKHIGRCLESLKISEPEIVVVDNASTDGTPGLVRHAFPTVKLIAAPRNLGFAAAANLGARQSSGAALLFLNPDVICHGSLAPLQQALNCSQDVVAVAPRLVDSQGRTQIGFVRRLPTPAALIFEILLLNRLFPHNPVNRNYRCLDLDHEQPGEVEQPAGACLLVRRDRFESCGGFDEHFFPLWFEDVDLCHRLRGCGRKGSGKILFWPQVSFQHAGGHSIESLTFSERQVYWYRNLLYYVRKHFPRKTGVVIRAALLCGVSLRIVAELPGLLAVSRARGPARGERVRAYLRAAKLSFLGWR